MYKLVISDDEGRTTVVPLLRDEITIGREEGNTIRLTERNVSRSHARLVRRNGSYTVEDLGSYNGIKLNGERIEEERSLEAGDHLLIGDYDLAYQTEDATSQTPPPPKVSSEPPARLVAIDEPIAGAEFLLNRELIRIGRSEDLYISIDHKSISHEHAELQIEDGKVTVFDLDSANGIRINGTETSRAILEPGDVLEIGVIRFRFVPQRAAQSLAPAVEEEAPAQVSKPTRRLPLALTLFTGVVVVGGGAIYVTMQGGRLPRPDFGFGSASESGEVAEVESPPPPEEVPLEVKEAELEVEERVAPVTFETALSGCRTALRTGEWSAALQQGRAALRLKAQSSAARRCVQRARAGIEDQAELEEAVAELRADRVESSYSLVAGLPIKSPLRDTDAFREIQAEYVLAHLSYGKRALRNGEIAKAKREAKLVLDVRGLPPSDRREARRLLSRARQAAAKSSAGADKSTSRRSDRIEEARACVERGDNDCVIRVLENGGARTPSSLALLIETYRATGNTAAAKGHMRTFVRRYPRNARTPRYQEMLQTE